MFFGLVVPNNSPKKLRILVRLPDGVFFRPKLLILHFVNVITKLCRRICSVPYLYSNRQMAAFYWCRSNTQSTWFAVRILWWIPCTCCRCRRKISRYRWGTHQSARDMGRHTCYICGRGKKFRRSCTYEGACRWQAWRYYRKRLIDIRWSDELRYSSCIL